MKTPLYLIQGKSDTIVDYKGPSQFYDQCNIKDKTIVLIDGKTFTNFLTINKDLNHDVPRCYNIDRLLEDIKFWLKQHC